MRLWLWKSIFDRIPFQGPALAAWVIGEATPIWISHAADDREFSGIRRNGGHPRP